MQLLTGLATLVIGNSLADKTKFTDTELIVDTRHRSGTTTEFSRTFPAWTVPTLALVPETSATKWKSPAAMNMSTSYADQMCAAQPVKSKNISTANELEVMIFLFGTLLAALLSALLIIRRLLRITDQNSLIMKDLVKWNEALLKSYENEVAQRVATLHSTIQSVNHSIDLRQHIAETRAEKTSEDSSVDSDDAKPNADLESTPGSAFTSSISSVPFIPSIATITAII